jgi:signal transduction histidine kinase
MEPTIPIQPLTMPQAGNNHVTLFKAIFDFHEDYRAEKLITLLDIFHEMILMVSDEGSILFANSEARNRLQLDDFSKHRVQDLFSLTKEQCSVIFHPGKSNDVFYRFESSVLSENDSAVQSDVSFFTLTSGPEISFWIIKDISDFKKIESSLARTDRKYKKILQETNDAVLILDNNFFIKEINLSGMALLHIEHFVLGEYLFLNYLDKEIAGMFHSFKSERKKIYNLQVNITIKIPEINTSVLMNFQPVSDAHEFIVFMKDISDELQLNQIMLRTIVNTQEKERERLSRDIHDDLGQQLSALKFHLSAFRNYTENVKAREILIESENILIDLMASVRAICFDLMPKSLEKNDLKSAVSELVRKMEAMHHLNINFHCFSIPDDICEETNVSVYRIIQEFLNNSMRHGKSRKIEVIFNTQGDDFFIQLSDDGIGFDLTDLNMRRGNGLDNIESRVKAFKGSVIFTSNPGQGTKYEIRLPYEKNKK